MWMSKFRPFPPTVLDVQKHWEIRFQHQSTTRLCLKAPVLQVTSYGSQGERCTFNVWGTWFFFRIQHTNLLSLKPQQNNNFLVFSSKVYLQSLPHHNKKKIDNIILSPASLWAHLPQPFRPCLFPSHRPDPHGEGNTFAIQDFEAITLHSLRSVPHHTTMDLLSYQKHRFRIRYNKCSVLRCLI